MLDAQSVPDLTSLSKAELKALQRQVQDALEKEDKRRRQDALAAVERAVEPFGFTLQEILPLATETKRGRTSNRSDGQDVKFRNPQNPDETWSGRGRRPFWFNAQLEAGASAEDLRV